MELTAKMNLELLSPEATSEWLNGFRALMDVAPDAMLVVGRDGTIVLSNREAESMFGYAAEEMVGHSVEMFLPERLHESHVLMRERYTWTEDARPMGRTADLVARRKDGTVIQVDISLNPQETPAGSYIICAIRDISERKRTEKALRYRDAVLQAVAFAAESFLTANKWSDCIDSVLAALGKAAEVSRVYVYENHQDESGSLRTSQRCEWTAPGIRALISRLELQNSTWDEAGFGRWAKRLSRGKSIHGSLSDFPRKEAAALNDQDVKACVAVPVFAGDTWWGFIGFDECIRDREWTDIEIEALKVAGSTLGAAILSEKNNRALRESEERFSRVFQHAPMAIRITSLEDDRILNVNDSYCNLIGFNRSELIGARTSSLGIHVRPQLYRRLLVLLREEGYFSNQEFQIRSKMGEIRDVVASADVTEIGGRQCAISMFYDITARKRLERELVQANDGEQRQLGYWLHEDLAQQLASISLMCGIHLQKLEDERSSQVAAMNRICQMLGDAVASSRSVSRRISPVDVRSEGLMYALRSLAEQTEKMYSVPCRFASREEVHIADNDVATYLYRIAQDTISNLMTHTNTAGVVIDLRRENGQGVLRIRNIKGAAGDPLPEEIELESMRYRAGIIGASVDVRRGTRRDTVIECFFSL